MTESETVQNSDRLNKTRFFEVDRDVDPSGEITMLAHLEISEGGGNLAPRVYFYDDTNGPTKQVHVGLVGPYYLVPGKSTNLDNDDHRGRCLGRATGDGHFPAQRRPSRRSLPIIFAAWMRLRTSWSRGVQSS